MNNKNLDQFFRDKFDSHNVNPPQIVWNNIKKELHPEEKRRVLPFWWNYLGIASIFLVGMGLSWHYFFNQTDSLTKKSVPVEGVQKQATETGSTATRTNLGNNATQVQTKIQTQNNDLDESSVTLLPSKPNNSSSFIFANVAKQSTKKKAIQKDVFGVNELQNQTVSTTNFDEKVGAKSQDSKELPLENKEKIFTTHTAKKPISQDPFNPTKENIIVELQNIDPKPTNPNVIAQDKAKPTDLVKKWYIQPQVAPVFLGSFAQGSSLDNSLLNNTKKYNTTFGFGVYLGYYIAPKWSVRTGVYTQEFNIDTHQVSYYKSVSASYLQNIEPSTDGVGYQILTAKNQNQVSNSMNKIAEKGTEGYLKQKLSYVEIPMEVTYALQDKKFGLQAIAGFSTLFCTKNEVHLLSDNFDVLIGKAKNINTTHFSANVGFGASYALSDYLKIQVEPMFKYHINTFSENSGNVKPYVFGIYSGIRFSF